MPTLRPWAKKSAVFERREVATCFPGAGTFLPDGEVGEDDLPTGAAWIPFGTSRDRLVMSMQ